MVWSSKYKLFEQKAKELGVKYKKYTAPYHPTSNGQIEDFHVFLKVYIAKHVSQQLEWDAVIPFIYAALQHPPELNILKNLLSTLCSEETLFCS